MTTRTERDSKGRFVKGSSGFNRKHSEETRLKMSKSSKNKGGWNRGLTKEQMPNFKPRKPKKDFLAHGYMKRWINGKPVLVHHINWSKANGGFPIPDGFIIHHRDMDKLNNDINNLLLLPQDTHIKIHWEYEKMNNIKRNYGKVI